MTKQSRSIHSQASEHADGLSRKFWQLADALATGWDMMNQILDQEWQILKSSKITPVWNLGRQKEKLARQLMAIEERIDREIPGLCKNATSQTRWEAMLRAASPSERSRLITWKTTLSSRKKRAFITNRRLWVWITEKQELNRELTAILSGRKQSNGLTYGMDGSCRPASDTKSAAAISGGSDTLSASEDGHFFPGFSSKKINRAMQAYRMTDSISERLESWD